MPVNIGQAEPGFEDPLGLMVACHRRIERFLAVLVDLAVRRDGSTLIGSESNAMGVALRYFRDAAPHHTADEEQGLFPALEQVDGRAACDLADLERDHRRAERLHTMVDELGLAWLRHGRLEEPEVRELQTALGELSALYREHIGAEEERVFPRAQQTLSRETLERIGRGMASRRGVAYIPSTVRLRTTTHVDA
jgi:hemerythrin-like domain-containing protein